MRGTLIVLAVLTSGCALLQRGSADHTGVRLEKAGFRVESGVPADGISYVIREQEGTDGIVYRYADPGRAITYAGGPAEYARYQELLRKEIRKRQAQLIEVDVGHWQPRR